MHKLIYVSLACLLLVAAAESDKCYTIAFSACSDKGPYEYGVLKGLIENLPANETLYDTTTGISMGGMNAALLASFPKGSEKEMIAEMERIWYRLTDEGIYKNWPGGVVEGLFFQSGLYDNSPIRDHLIEIFEEKEILRSLSVSVTNMNNASFIQFENSYNKSDFVEKMMATLTLPILFGPTLLGGDYWLDGQSIWSVDISQGIHRCIQKGYKPSDVVVDAVIGDEVNLNIVDASNYKTLQYLTRTLAVSSFYKTLDNLLRSMHAYPDTHFRYVVAPTKNLPSSIKPLKYSDKQVKKMIDQGYEDALTSINKGEGRTLSHLLEWHAQKLNGKAKGIPDLHTFTELREQNLA